MSASTQSQRLPIRVFLDKRIVTIFFLGLAQGFPWFIAGTALNLWLQESGLSRSNIGLAGAIFLAYSINFLWSPLVDRFNFGIIGRKFGGRRTWILVTQSIVVFACFYASNFSPENGLRELIVTMIVIAIAAATQDIAIDALRIDLIQSSESNHLTAAASAITAGWWTGYAGLGFFPLWLSDLPSWTWQDIYPLLAVMMTILMIAPLLCREPQTGRREKQMAIKENYIVLLTQQPRRTTWQLFALILSLPALAIWAASGSPFLADQVSSATLYIPFIVAIEIAIFTYILKLLWASSNHIDNGISSYKANNLHLVLAWLLVTIVEPLKVFFSKNGLRLGLSILLFIFLFKMGEAFLARMSIVFYKEVGFSNTDIAVYSKLTTWWVTILCALAAGMINMRFGVVKGLFFSGLAMAATNLLFSVIAMVGPVEWLFFATVVVDGLTQAWSSVAFVAVMSMLCDRTFSASQYALMISLGAMGRTLISSTSGFVVDWLDGNWAVFFVLTALLVIPSLLILVKIGPQITRIETENANMPAPASQ